MTDEKIKELREKFFYDCCDIVKFTETKDGLIPRFKFKRVV